MSYHPSAPADAPADAMAARAWHALAPEAALRLQDSEPQTGLSTAQAQARAARHGSNSLPQPPRRTALRRLLLQFHNVLIYVLLGAAAVTLLLGHWLDSGVILAVVLANVLIGFLQEGKAESALQAIRLMLPFDAQVIRDGRQQTVPAQSLVPGDIVMLASGDKVPADLRLLQLRGLRIDESALTGESLPVDKRIDAVAPDCALGDRRCMAYSGSLVTYGTGTGVVVAIGAGSEIGRISGMLAEVEQLATPLLRQMAVFGRRLTWAILGFVSLSFGLGTLVGGYAVDEMLLAAVGLAVAAIPEGLPAIMTITLAIGVQRMARRNAIIRHLPAVETLGAVTVICTDKTGTLTRNEMTVRQIITADGEFAVGGVGYAPEGEFSFGEETLNLADHAWLRELGRAALLCNDASLRQAGDEWLLAGDPTEGALVCLAAKAGLDERAERLAAPRMDVIPFESEHAFMATLHAGEANGHLILLKGAPERVLALCHWQREGDVDRPLAQRHWQARMEAAAADGLRLLALARRHADTPLAGLDFPAIHRGGFTLLAVLALADPPRPEAIAAVARCRAAGIDVKMITGDHQITARAIGEQLGLAAPLRSVSGAELDGMDDAELVRVATQTQVFARASPEHKLRLVRALQRQGEVVAMTGDGVNDAPALKQANVGVAMGKKGTEAAKEAAEMVLADDNFASIAAAVEEGRTVYENIRKAIVFILPTNGGEAGMLLIALLLGLTLPITPVQILWVNMVTAITLSLALAFETPEADIMLRSPRQSHAPLLDRFLLWRIAMVTLLLIGGGIGLFLWELQQGASLALARTVAVNALVMGEIVYLFNVRRSEASALNWGGLTGNRYALLAVGLLLVLQALFTYLPAMQALFGTAAVPGAAWARILLFGLGVFLLVELEKWLRRRFLVQPLAG